MDLKVKPLNPNSPSSTQLDEIYDALVAGMNMEEAYAYAALNPDQIEYCNNNLQLQTQWKKITYSLEYDLLNRMNEISKFQAAVGNDRATTWMLEHYFPRFAKVQPQQHGDVHLHFSDRDPASYDTVEINSADLEAPEAPEAPIRKSLYSE